MSFDGISAGGFQMNPLSDHPPRTPRTSVAASNAPSYNPGIYVSQEEAEERPTDLEEEVGVEYDLVKSQARARVTVGEIWHDIVKSSAGRDKAFKMPPFVHLARPLDLHPSGSLSAVLLELVHTCADDIATWSLLGLLGKRIGERAAHFADWCWFASTLVNLVENSVERSVIVNSQRSAKSTPHNTKVDEMELQRLQREDFWLQIQRAKLVMDLIFVSYNVFKVQRGKEVVKTTTGLASAILSSSRLFDRHRNQLMKAVSF
ncbi:hypothetical protein EWM64_g3744 [Hericium alpestre]|uniref:Uncharacterized protein n=1 Tax=Hericium alpestre TaxID=135208 RepID=A0A4Z0A3J4_9AGAM|nr:hypothetical protein EWM64_g3744 [Hericium alpestre]